MPGKSEILNLQFIEARHSLVELAAFLDRFDRHEGPTDFRLEALKNALPILMENQPDRARKILESLSDSSTDPVLQAIIQGASGAPKPDH
ncbi:MAG: hypothetical protein RLZ22_563 [Verrucomicrobiota bacterium]|jgi:hypothetical protein